MLIYLGKSPCKRKKHLVATIARLVYETEKRVDVEG